MPTAPDALDPGHVLVMVEDASGWPASKDQFDPRIATLYADGTLVARDQAPEVVLDLRSATLPPARLDDAWAGVLDAGLAVDRELELPGLYDAGTTVIRTDDGRRATKLSIYALGSTAGDDATFPPDEFVLRANATSVIAELVTLAASEPYAPPAMLLWWATYEDYPGGAVAPRVAWTPPVDLATAGGPTGLPDTPVWSRCALLDGAVAAGVADFARGVAPGTVVEQAGVDYTFTVRPIYPDEVGSVACP